MAYDTYEQAVAEMDNRYKQHFARLREIWGVTESEATSDFDYVGKSRALVKNYRTDRKQHSAKTSTLKAEYKGDRLKKELADHEATAPDKEAIISQLKAYEKSYLDFLNEKGAASMSDPTIDEAFKWLSRPVTLTAEELQMLHDQHADNVLFCRALREYVAAKKDQYGVDFDFRDSIAVRREIVEGFTRNLESYVRDLDDWNFDIAEAAGYFESIDECLKGNGLFAQPKSVESNDEETAAPEPDSFAQGFTGGTP